MTKFWTINPATGQKLKTYPLLSASELDAKISLAHTSYLHWRTSDFATRTKLFEKIAKIITRDREKLGQLATLEMGKRLSESLAELDKCALTCLHFATHAPTQLAPEIITTEAQKSYISFEPLGVVLSIMPWNFPYWQVFRAAAPALMTGNSMLLKHASSVPGCALAIQAIFEEAGAPKGLFQTLLMNAPDTSLLIADPRIRFS